VIRLPDREREVSYKDLREFTTKVDAFGGAAPSHRLLWPLLLPLGVIFVPLVGVWSIAHRLNPLRVSCAVLRLVGSIGGTHVEIEHPHGSFVLSIV
jgi:hypothetical protein